MHHANSFLPSAHEIHHKVPASHLGHQKDFRTAMGSGIAIASRRIFNILPIRYTSGPQHVRTQEQSHASVKPPRLVLARPHLVADATGVFFPPSLAPVHSTSGIGEWPVASAQHASCELVLAISPRNPSHLGTAPCSGCHGRFFPPSSAPVHTTSGIPQGASQLSGAPERLSYCNGP